MPAVDPNAGNRLIVLRGNSGSGKTTLASALQRRLGRGTANIGQDHLRRVILWERDVPGGENVAFIEHTVRYCLGIGYDVILEGILSTAHYGEMLRSLLADHDGPRHVFYLDLPLEETFRRHELRPEKAEFGAAEMTRWYLPRDVLGVPGEIVLDTREQTPEETLEALVEHLDRG